MWSKANIRMTFTVCAFCKHWYDPGNTHIRPYNAFFGKWEYEQDVKSYCEIWRVNKRSQQFCPRYECKVSN